MEVEIRRLEYRSLGAKAGKAGGLPTSLLAAIGGVERDGGPPSFSAQAQQIMLLESKVAELRRALEEGNTLHAEEVRVAREEALHSAEAGCAAEVARIGQEAEARMAQTHSAFMTERNAYFARAEGELVKLALGVAARILHREAQMDALLLRGAVRVALSQLQEGATATLRVPESDLPAWHAWQQKTEQVRLSMSVLGDSSLHTGDCRIELQAGSVDLGVQAQMAEIERGFFDLLAQRPMAGA
ncbi:MAG: FliH/SctL family protein [Acidobacteriaceae bacterium]